MTSCIVCCGNWRSRSRLGLKEQAAAVTVASAVLEAGFARVGGGMALAVAVRILAGGVLHAHEAT